MRFGGLIIDTVVCLTLAKWETVSGQFGGYLTVKQDKSIKYLNPNAAKTHQHQTSEEKTRCAERR